MLRRISTATSFFAILSAGLLLDKYLLHQHTVEVERREYSAAATTDQLIGGATPTSEILAVDQNKSVGITIMTFSNGQRWCNRNSILNACYQDYPLQNIELFVVESSITPSLEFTSLLEFKTTKEDPDYRFGKIEPNGVNGESRNICGGLHLRYFWFNSEDEFGTKKNPKLGALRNMMTERSTGEIIINMDNDDFFHPRYVSTVVDASLVTSAEAKAPTLTAFIEVKPHAVMVLNPDGTRYITSLTGDPSWGAHIISMTKSITKKCEWLYGVAYDEERKLLSCIDTYKFPRKQIKMEGINNIGNGLLMIKFKSGMSITHQRFFKGRTEFARMSHEDWEAQLDAQRWAYEELHELTRPSYFPPWFGKIMPEFDRPAPLSGTLPPQTLFNSLLPERVVLEQKPAEWWRTWHTKRKDFYDKSGLASIGCDGFASMPGQVFNSTIGEQIPATSNIDCCNKCTAASHKDNVCTAFAFKPHMKHCVIWITKSKRDKPELPGGLRYRPETYQTERTFGLIAAYPKLAEG